MTETVTVWQGDRVVEYDVPVMPHYLPSQIDDALEMSRVGKMCLFSEPGTGKTLTALYAVNLIHDRLIEEKHRHARVLIVVPNIAVRNWIKWSAATFVETSRKSSDEVIQRAMTTKDKIQDGVIYFIVTYGMLSRKDSKMVKTILDWKPDVVILDESDNLNGIDARRAQVVYGSSKGEHLDESGIVYAAKWAWAMTGTPIRRYADDLFTVLRSFYFKDMKLHGVHTKVKFQSRFCQMQARKYPGMRFPVLTAVGSKNMSDLHWMLYGQGLATRRRLVDVAKYLPTYSEREVVVSFKMSPLLQLLLDEIEEGMVDAEGEVVDDNSTARQRGHHQLGLEKVPSAAEYISDVVRQKRANGDKSGVLALVWHRDVAASLKHELDHAGFRCSIISGATTTKQDEQTEDDFNDHELDVVVAQIAAAGVSLNLQKGANYVVFVERSWSDASNVQAIDRVFRMGQEHHVQVDFLVTETNLDGSRTEVLAKKRRFADRVVDGR